MDGTDSTANWSSWFQAQGASLIDAYTAARYRQATTPTPAPVAPVAPVRTGINQTVLIVGLIAGAAVLVFALKD